MDSGRKGSIADMTDMGWDLKLPGALRKTASGTAILLCIFRGARDARMDWGNSTVSNVFRGAHQ